MPTVLISSRGTRLALSIAVIAATGVLTGCPPQPPPLSTTRPAVGDLAGQDAPSLGTQPVTGGIYVPLEDAAKPLDAAALEKARLDRASIYDHVKQKVAVPETRPAATQPVASAQSATTRPGEKSDDGTPPMAVKYYLQGRELFLQGANSEAMDRLEKALQLDPDAFTVLRLMGRVCFAASQLARGSMYLERAQRLRPQDVEANYLLGRYWLERKDYDRATYYLMQADDSPERLQTSTQTPLSAFYLARSYQAGGYHLAAAKEFERFITLASVPVPGYRYDRELSYLIDEEWTAALSAAENFVRVGEYVGALSHYQKAADAQPKDLFIASRQINALAHAGKLDAARERALTLVVSTNGGGEETIKLLAWTYRASGKEGQAIGDLRSRLAHSGGDDATLALTLSATQEYLGNREEAFATLRNYLREHPANMDVLKRLLKRVTTPEEFQAALAAAGAAVAADRSKHAEITREFISLTESSAGASFAKNAVPLKQGNFASEYLAALTARAHNAEPSVIDGYFQQSIKQAADFAPARDAYVAWLLGQERFTQATQIVQNAVSANPNDPATWQLLVQAEAAQQRYLSALQLAQDARRKFPGNAEVRLQLASVYRLRGQENEADAELTSLITEQPKNEQAYEALINAMLLRTRRPGTAGAGASQSSAVSVLAKMNRELPDSRYAQIHSAIFFARGGRLEEAELVLRRLQAESPEDPDVLIPLSQIRQLLDHVANAFALRDGKGRLGSTR